MGHLHHLRSLRTRDFSQYHELDYCNLFKLLGQNPPQLETTDLDFKYTDFDDRVERTVAKSLQPQLDLLTNLKHAKIHSQLLWPSPFDIDLRKIYNVPPPNLEYLELVGLDLNAIVQLDEDENDEDVEDDMVDIIEDVFGSDEVDDEILEQSDPDPFFICYLRAVLPCMTHIGFRFDFHVNTESDLDQEL